MPVTVYRFDDAGAPQLLSTAGLITVLDAVLVNGYGAKPAAGWSKAFSGTNKAAYLQGAGGNGHYVRIDATPTPPTCYIRGFEAMTSVDAGTNMFPLNGQAGLGDNGPHIVCTNTASAVTRPWIMVASSNYFYIWTYNVDVAIPSNPASVSITFFGKFESFKSVDPYSTCLIAQTNTAESTTYFGQLQSAVNPKPGSGIARSVTEFAGAVEMQMVGDGIFGANVNLTQGLNFPDPVTGGINLTRPYITERSGNSVIMRGRLPGLWLPLHVSSQFPDNGQVFQGTGTLAGKTFLVLSTYGTGKICLEIQ